MVTAPFRVVLDANVLFPFTLRDTLLRAAALGLYQVYWSEEILDEFPEAMVSEYETLVSAMPNDEKDRHVTAVAVKAGAQVVVTSNMKDFHPMPNGVEAQSPDSFLLNLLDISPWKWWSYSINKLRH